MKKILPVRTQRKLSLERETLVDMAPQALNEINGGVRAGDEIRPSQRCFNSLKCGPLTTQITDVTAKP